MKNAKSLTAVAFVALSCASVAAFAQLAPSPTSLQSTITSPTTTTTTTTSTTSTAPAPTSLQSSIPAPAPAAPVATPFQGSKGLGYEHANEHGKEAIEDHFEMSGTVDKTNHILDVTSITHGRIKVGTKLSGAGLPGKGIEITEMLTGKGGVGTYKFKPL